jgi:CRISPR-associated protein Cmr1
MPDITARFHVSTPLFLGNAAQEPELLAAPFKHALRFWWRALRYDLVDPGPSFVRLLHREAQLFGVAAGDGSGRRSPFALRAAFSSAAPQQMRAGDVLDEAREGLGLIYLGYGLLHAGRRATPDRPAIERGMLQRGCLWRSDGFDLALTLSFPRAHDDADLNELIDAIKVMGLLGGLGGRSRRGFGSLTVVELRGPGIEWSAPARGGDYVTALREVLQYRCRHALKLPEYTAFGPASRIDIIRATREDLERDPARLLDWLGLLLQKYRSSGQTRGRIGRREVEGLLRFPKDHDGWYTAWRGFDRRHPPIGTPVPQRLVFGLPQPYRETLRVIGPLRDGEDAYIDRRASPLFIHTHRLSSEQYAIVLTLIPAQFVPGDVVTVEADKRPYSENYSADFDVIEQFFDATHLVGPDRGKFYFPSGTTVWPADEESAL